MKRRGWLIGGAGAAAAAAGLGWRGFSESRREAHRDATTGGLWQMSFDRPDGARLAMASLRGQPLVLNFWATWCPPCIREMPELDRFQRAFAARGWQVLGLAIDRPQPVREFLARTPVGYTIAMAGFDGTELTRRLGNASGGLPFTVVFDREGLVAHRKLGETSFDELARWAAAT
ncbi:MAG: TlpA disulfide reductase family protein [Rubrivivax sp.]|nr:TlpA disulfide reductase family protein [Rubrivivax sp.]